jgi:pimeloyl-ACP methyl ester carboxylesterase
VARFVLVHGSWQSSEWWRDVAQRLNASGHQAVAFDLPGHGKDRTSIEKISFQGYVDRTVQEIGELSEGAILVGASMGGAIISQVAEMAPERVRALICVAALMPPDGRTMMDLVDGMDPSYIAQFIWAPDGLTARVTREALLRFGCLDRPESVLEFVGEEANPEPAAPYQAPLRLTEANFGRVPRYYIECSRDGIVPLALQRSMCKALRFTDVFSLDAGHFPNLTVPEELTSILIEVARRS